MYDTIAHNPYLFTAVLIWVLAWKGVALWTAAKANSKKWFVALLVINTLGILDILYIYCFSNKNCQIQENK